MAWTFYNATGEALITHAESEAKKEDMEAETAIAHFVPPDLVKNSPGVAKVWVMWEQTGAHSMLASYNMTSVTDGGSAGNTDHLWNVDFSSGTYAIVTGPTHQGPVHIVITSIAAGGVTTISVDGSGSDIDRAENYLAAFGDQ